MSYHGTRDTRALSDSPHTRDISKVSDTDSSSAWIFPLEGCHKTSRKEGF